MGFLDIIQIAVYTYSIFDAGLISRYASVTHGEILFMLVYSVEGRAGLQKRIGLPKTEHLSFAN